MTAQLLVKILYNGGMLKTSIALVFLFIGLVSGIFVGKNIDKDKSDTLSREVRLDGYKYISPLLECEYNQAIGEREYRPSKNKIASFVTEEINKKTISHASVYYRDLNNGPWFGIEEKENFSPTSLLKLPVLIAYFKQAEEDRTLLQKKLTYKKVPAPIEQSFTPENLLVDNKKYTIEELLEHMIVYSDNNALFLLEKNIDEKKIDAVTKDLGIEIATDSTPEDYMSVRSYASLFRVLYNASYLNKEMSEKALTILGKVAFTKGVVAGLPNTITVAHKFGERELENGIKQLHDCGIVYYPKHPYLLCVMTRGTNYENLSSAISNVSRKIYEDIDNRYNK